jgi:hypothetical protein
MVQLKLVGVEQLTDEPNALAYYGEKVLKD